MRYFVVVKGKLPSLNEFLAAERRTQRGRRGYSPGNALKQQCELILMNAIRRQLHAKIRYPIYIRYTYYEPDRRRDLDNISSVVHKFFQDALCKAQVIKNDNWDHIVGFSDEFHVDKKNPRIEIVIEERQLLVGKNTATKQ